MLASGRSEAWLSRLLWEQETMSSNLIVPTIRLMRSWPNRRERFSFLFSSDCHFLHSNHGDFPIFHI